MLSVGNIEGNSRNSGCQVQTYEMSEGTLASAYEVPYGFTSKVFAQPFESLCDKLGQVLAINFSVKDAGSPSKEP